MKSTSTVFLHGFRASWLKFIGLMLWLLLDLPALLLAQNPAHGIKLECLSLDRVSDKTK